MGKLQLYEILLDNPQAVFYPGQVVSGRLNMTLSEEMQMRGLRLRFQGRANVHWTTGSSKNRTHHRNHQEYFDMVAVLFGKAEHQKGEDPMHPAGQHVYPFQFILPQNLPSSFEGVCGRVRYWLQAVIDKPWKFNHYCKQAFTVLSTLDLNTEPGINVTTPKTGQNEKTLCCLCCTSGPITADLRLERTGYVPGEYIAVNGEVTNHSNRKMESSSIQILMRTVYFSRVRSTSRFKTVSKIKKGQIPVGGSEVYSGEPLYIPPLPPSMLPNCDIIQIHYAVVIQVDPAGPAISLSVPIDIVIGTIPLRNTQAFFANAPCPYSLTMNEYSEDPQTPALPHQPPESAESAPPPSYAECVLGKVDLHDENDNEHTRGQMSWAPSYPYYTWSNPQTYL